MLDTRILNELLDWLSDLLGTDYRTAQARPSGAGCINETYEIYSQQLDSVFVKVGPVGQLDMYEKEALGLQLLDQCPAIRVPAVLGAARLQHCKTPLYTSRFEISVASAWSSDYVAPKSG